MKTTAKTIILGFLFLMAACVPSLNPLYTDQDLIFDTALIGAWSDKDSKETWEFTEADDKEYKLIYTDEDVKKGEFEARLLKIEGKTFMDITPIKPVFPQNDFYKGHFLATHTFVQIIQTGPKFEIAYLEPKWLKGFLDKNPGAIGHVKIEDEILLTDTSKNLQKFLLTHLNTPDAFAEPVEMVKGKRGVK